MTTILIIDNDSLGARRAADALRHAGYACVCAGGGDEALALLAPIRPDLVLLAGQLAGLSASQVLREIRLATHDRHLPVVLLTDPLTQDCASVSGGVQAYVRKPFDPRFLRYQVDRVLRRERQFRHPAAVRHRAGALRRSL